MTEPADVLNHLAEQQRQRILSMPAGAALDAEVEREVFGVEITCSAGINCADIPPYSSDAGAAWLVVERLKSPAHRVIIHVWDNEVRVWIKPGWSSVYGPGAGAETFPLAVCRAALTTKAALLATLEARPR